MFSRLRGKGLAAQLIRGSGGGFVARIASAGISLLSFGILTNHMGTSAFGTYSYALAWLNVLAMIGRLGFNKSATRFLAAYRGAGDWGRIRGFIQYCRRTTYWISIGAGLVGAAVLAVFWQPIAAYYDGEPFIWTMLIALLSLPLMSYLQVSEGVLDGFKRVGLSQVPLRMARPALIALLTLGAFAWLSAGKAVDASGTTYFTAQAAMVVNLAATLLALLLAGFIVARTLPPEARQATPVFEKPLWFSTSRDMVWTSGFNLIIVEANLILLGALNGSDEAGLEGVALFNVASKVAQLLIIALTATNAILQPISADLFARKKLSDLQRIVSIGANGVFAIAVAGAAVLYVGSGYLGAIFGPQFSASAPYLIVLIFGQVVNAFTGPSLLLLNMTGHQRDAARIMGIAALINVVLNVLLIQAYGALGAAYATAASIIIWNALAAVVVWYRLGIVSIALYYPARRPPSP